MNDPSDSPPNSKRPDDAEAPWGENALDSPLSRAALLRVLEVAEDAIVSIDESHRILLFNRGAEKVFGYARREVLGQPIDLLLPERFRDVHATYLQQLRQGGRVARWMNQRGPIVGLRKNRSEFSAEASISHISDGERSIFTVVLRDITQRMQEAQALQNLLAGTAVVGSGFFEALVRHLAAALGVKYAAVTESLDPQHTRLRALGFWSNGDLQDGVEYETARTPCEQVIKTGAYCYFPDRVAEQFPDDELLAECKAESYMGMPLHSPSGDIIGHLCIFHDGPLPDMHRARTFLSLFAARASAELGRRQTEQRLRDNEAQLQQAQRMEAVGRLAGGIAHDFNNLLTVIRGYADMSLKLIESNAVLLKNVEGIVQASERASELTGKLLAFSRGHAVQAQVFDLNRVVADMGSMLERLIGEHITLSLRTPALHLWVESDLGQIEQMVINLAANARDVMPTGGSLTIQTDLVVVGGTAALSVPELTPGKYVRLSVSDTGPGIESDVLPHIFEPFFTTKEFGKGTGLGLSTVYGIVTRSGGAIDVTSTPGFGTTFAIYLPYAEVEPVRPVHAAAAAEGSRGAETILVAEDDEGVRHVTAMTLREAGYVVVEASDGAEALEIVRTAAEPFHLVVSDVVMPRMTGNALAAALAKERPEIRVLLISGYAESSGEWPRLPAQGRRFLSKPFTPEALIRAVREMLDA